MRRPKSKALIVLAATLVSLAGIAGRASAAYKTVTVQDNGQRKVIRGFTFGTVGRFLTQHGIHVRKQDRISPPINTAVANGMRIFIRRPIRVTLVDGAQKPGGHAAVWRQWTFSHTVRQLLQEHHVRLHSQDTVSQPLASALTPGETVRVRRVLRITSTLTQKIPFQTIRQRTESLRIGQHRVLTYGVEGLLRKTTTRVFVDGKPAAVHVRRSLLRRPVNEVIEDGAAQVPQPKSRTTVTALSGRSEGPLSVLKTLTVVATAYVGGGRTATGDAAEPGIVAVDPSVIPLGTKLYVPGVGVVRAEDTGSAIVGNRIDVCVSSWQQAQSFGVRTLTIYELQG